MAKSDPIILVHGLFGFGPGEFAELPYWGTGRSVPGVLPRREASVGPVSSTHDRACELAWQIKGGRVDYGEGHAAESGHRRHGRTFEGREVLHPGWSEDHRVHLVGHSMGGPTIWMCQQLLAEDYWGWGSTADWITSITSISGVLNGSTATYFFGCDEETGLLGAESAGGFIGRALEVFLRATGGLFDRFYDFDLDHWPDLTADDPDASLAAQEGESLKDYTGRIAASPMFWGKDNAAYSITIQGLLEQNARCVTHPNTYYFSYATEQTFGGYFSGHHYPEPDMNPLAIPSSIYMGRAEYDEPFYDGFRSEDWWHNDGLVSVHSQLYPHTAGVHPVGGTIDDHPIPQPGRWYHQLLEDTDHIDIVALPQLGRVGDQRRFYASLYEKLATL